MGDKRANKEKQAKRKTKVSLAPAPSAAPVAGGKPASVTGLVARKK
ncbi:hypothetical protein ABMC89_07875 [Sulfitobacter sp. HNIBRBA3233]